MIKKQCIICGMEFESKVHNAKFCSEECRNSKVYTNDHVGENHFELKIKSAYRKKSKLYVECECSCGNKCTVLYNSLLNGNTQSCGHIGERNLIKPINLIGKTNKYGVKALYSVGKRGKLYVWRCLCTCGKEFDTTTELFKRIKSCGCRHDEIRKRVANTTFKDFREIANIDGTSIYSIQKRMFKNNTSGIRGVVRNKNRKKWVAQIVFKGKNYYLGTYEKIEDAANARKEAEENLFGNFLEWFSDKYPGRWEKINKNHESDNKKDTNI